MRIGIDARELCGQPTGVGRYLGGLLAAWSADERARRHEFLLYAHREISARLDARRFATRAVPGSGGTWWEQVELPAAAAREHLDAWFSPAYSMPLRLTVPAVVAIHDLSFVAHPEWFRLREGARRRLLVTHSARRARAIITISDFSRAEIVERLGIDTSKIHVIPPGISPQPSSLYPSPQPSALSPSVLCVGSIFNRRHVPVLVRAFGAIARARPDATLDIVGDNRSFPFEDLPRIIASEGLDGRARWHRFASDERLRDLYSKARAFAFLSEYEGLGLTPLEALAAGVPPMLLDTPVARESCGKAALYVPRPDVALVSRGLEQLLFSETTRARVLAAAPDTLERYQWPRAAAETLRLIEGTV